MQSQQISPGNRGNGHDPLSHAIAALSEASRALGDAVHALETAFRSGARSVTQGGQQRRPRSQPRPLSERLTQRQLAAVRAASRRAGLNESALSGLVEEVSERAASVEELSKMEASTLIDKIDAMSGYGR